MDTVMTEWQQRLKQEIADGKRCMTCHRWCPLLSSSNSGPVNCLACKGVLNGFGEADHHKFVRCPKCRCHFDAGEYISNEDHPDRMVAEIWLGEDVEFECPKCQHKFLVQTCCETTYTSPPVDTGDNES